MERDTPILVAGAGGFIGGHLVRRLQTDGFADIATIDRKNEKDWWYLPREEKRGNLSILRTCKDAVKDRQVVINLAADMGGMGFIEQNKLDCMLNVRINTHLLMAAARANVGRYFFASSACVYSQALQTHHGPPQGLLEDDAYPALPEDGYGWEKLFSERMCVHFGQETSIEPRIGRFHAIYGPNGTWTGGREKVPAALCRKVAVAKLGRENRVEVWGDGTQVRSFLYVDDAVEAVLRLLDSDLEEPVNIGSAESVTINQLLRLICEIAEVEPEIVHVPGPLGVAQRSADHSLLTRETGWEPSTTLREGLENTYRWVHSQVATAL